MNQPLRVSKMRRIKSKLIFSFKKIKNQKKWTKEEDDLLISLAEKFNEKNWKEIAKSFEKKNPLQCFSRYKRIRPGIVKGSWKKEEDFKIIELVKTYGKSWSKISKILGTRNGKQIRDRYINVLDPEIKKGKFTEEEDQYLIELYNQHGSKWATIAKFYPNRTADMIKNRYHSSIKKKLSTSSSSQDMREAKVSGKAKTAEVSTRPSIDSQISDPGQNKHTDISKRNKEKDIQKVELQTKDYEYLLASTDILNYVLQVDKEINSNDLLENGRCDECNWNLEDYFAI